MQVIEDMNYIYPNYIIRINKKNIDFMYIVYRLLINGYCDAPNPGCPLTTRQPTENLYVSCLETHT